MPPFSELDAPEGRLLIVIQPFAAPFVAFVTVKIGVGTGFVVHGSTLQ